MPPPLDPLLCQGYPFLMKGKGYTFSHKIRGQGVGTRGECMTCRPTKLIKCLHPLSNSESLLFSDVGWVVVLSHSASIRVKMSFTHVQTAEHR